MPRYIVKEPTTIEPLREGDYPQPLEFIVPDTLPMENRSAMFLVTDRDGNLVIVKLPINDTIEGGEPCVQVDGQLVTIRFDAADTTGKYGTYKWFLKVTDADELITVGYGQFPILRTS